MRTPTRGKDIINLVKDAAEVIFYLIILGSIFIPGATDYWLPTGFSN